MNKNTRQDGGRRTRMGCKAKKSPHDKSWRRRESAGGTAVNGIPEGSWEEAREAEDSEKAVTAAT